MLHAGVSGESHGVLAASSSGPGGNQGFIGQFNDGSITGVVDQNGNVQPFSNGVTQLPLATIDSLCEVATHSHLAMQFLTALQFAAAAAARCGLQVCRHCASRYANQKLSLGGQCCHGQPQPQYDMHSSHDKWQRG